MSSKNETAEQRFTTAFERLKLDTPINLKKGSPVSQNNVAKEAGASSTALRKKRYPQLVREIQDWIAKRDTLKVKKKESKGDINQEVSPRDEIIKRITKERDLAQSELVSTHRQLLELLEQNSQLQRRVDELLPAPTRLRLD